MKSYIFNEEYFKEAYSCKENITEKSAEICEKVGMSDDTFVAKRMGKRVINRDDYERIKEVDPLLLLDTQQLISKFFKRLNLDTNVNQRFVAYIMLCEYDDRSSSKKWVSVEELGTKYIFKSNKVVEILESATIIVDENGNKEKLFIKNEKGLYVINITACIKYSNI